MKRTAVFIIAVILSAIFLTSCAKEVPAPEVIPSRPAEAAEPTDTIPESLTQLEGIASEDIAYIEFWNESMSPDSPVTQYASDADISSIFSQLQSIRLTAPDPLEPEEIVPGGFGYYLIHLFSEKEITVLFHINETVLVDEEHYTFEPVVEHPDPAIILRTEQPCYPADTESIEYTAYNGTEEKYAIQLIPQLERMTENGWEKLEYGDIGFCGTPDPFPSGGTVDFFSPSWFKDMSAGTYRLSLYYFKDGEEYLISTIFELE